MLDKVETGLFHLPELLSLPGLTSVRPARHLQALSGTLAVCRLRDPRAPPHQNCPGMQGELKLHGGASPSATSILTAGF
jgi:hypothetical protein